MMWRDLFLFSIYAGGLRFSDVIEMQYSNYNEAEHKIKNTFVKLEEYTSSKLEKWLLIF
jgi:integrase/recombinase XerD